MATPLLGKAGPPAWVCRGALTVIWAPLDLSVQVGCQAQTDPRSYDDHTDRSCRDIGGAEQWNVQRSDRLAHRWLFEPSEGVMNGAILCAFSLPTSDVQETEAWSAAPWVSRVANTSPAVRSWPHTGPPPALSLARAGCGVGHCQPGVGSCLCQVRKVPCSSRWLRLLLLMGTESPKGYFFSVNITIRTNTFFCC